MRTEPMQVVIILLSICSSASEYFHVEEIDAALADVEASSMSLLQLPLQAHRSGWHDQAPTIEVPTSAPRSRHDRQADEEDQTFFGQLPQATRADSWWREWEQWWKDLRDWYEWHSMHPSCKSHYCMPAIFLDIMAFTLLFLGLGRCQKLIASHQQQAAVREVSNAAMPAAAHLKALDGLKGVFMVYIVLEHAHYTPSRYVNAKFMIQYFFVASGFVNFKSTERQRDYFDWSSGLTFIQRRMARLLPLYWFAILLCALLMAALGNLCYPVNWFVEAAGLQTFTPSRILFAAGLYGNIPDWFVSALLVLNVFYPFLYNLTPTRPRAMFSMLLVLTAARSLPLCTAEFPPFTDYGFPFTHLVEFMVGMLAAAWCSQLPAQVLAWSGWGFVFDASIVLSCLVAVALQWLAKTHQISVHSPMMFTRGTDSYPNSEDYGVTGIFCITCIAAFAAVEGLSHGPDSPPGYWPRLGLLGCGLSSGPLQLLGKYSYHAYLLCVPALLAMHYLHIDVANNVGQCLLSIAFVLFVSLLADTICEKPAQSLLERYFKSATK